MANQGNKKKDANDKDLPGYPHYPAKEDITRPENNNGKVNMNEENISLPNVKDIPGQEHIIPPPPGMMADTTASSADEEDLISGDTLNMRDEDDEVRIVMGTEADVTLDDLRLLDGEDTNIAAAALDDIDEDGEQLNEFSDETDMGKDLDVPGSEADDRNENIGEEDEENNYYSLGSHDNDELTEGTP